MFQHFLGLSILESPEIRDLLPCLELEVDVSTFLRPIHSRITRNQRSTSPAWNWKSMFQHFLGLSILESPEIRDLLPCLELEVDVSTFLRPIHSRITRNQRSTSPAWNWKSMFQHFLGLSILESPEIRDLLPCLELEVDVSTFLRPIHSRITRNQRSTPLLGTGSRCFNIS